MQAFTPELQPNFILIQCDDLGWDDLGLHGNEWVETPNLDSLGRESTRFSAFTVNPTCAPSRATLLTGRHFLRTGVSHVHGGKDFLHLDERTLADNLRAAGYATGMWGKWHSGYTEGYYPWQRGFDEAYMAQLYRHRATRGLFNGTEVEHERWADEVMADYAIDFIRRHREQPFFAYFSTMTPHSRHDAPERWVAHYREKGLSDALSKLWGMVSFLDEQVARILGEIDALGLEERTVVVFKSDNGPAIDGAFLSDADRRLRKVTGLRGWKGDLYENGVRSPLFIRWAGRIEPREIDTPLDLADLAPTLLDLAGVEPVSEALPMDGRSFRRLLEEPGRDKRPALIFNYAHRGWLTTGPPYSLDGLPGEYRPLSPDERRTLPFAGQSISVREGSYKLMLNPDYFENGEEGRMMLVDLATDPLETTDLSDCKPEIRDRLLGALKDWWMEIRREPHSFAAPVFQLTLGENTIPARAPAALDGAVCNTVTELMGWHKPGDRARYSLFGDAPGRAEITLRWRGDMPAGVTWRLRVPETGASAETDGTDSVVLSLPQGVFHLEIELAQVPANEEPLPSLGSVGIHF